MSVVKIIFLLFSMLKQKLAVKTLHLHERAQILLYQCLRGYKSHCLTCVLKKANETLHGVEVALVGTNLNRYSLTKSLKSNSVSEIHFAFITFKCRSHIKFTYYKILSALWFNMFILTFAFFISKVKYIGRIVYCACSWTMLFSLKIIYIFDLARKDNSKVNITNVLSLSEVFFCLRMNQIR